MAISLQADSTLPQGYILVNGQRVASVSTTGGLSATLAANTVTTSSLVSGAITSEKIASNSVTPEKMSGGQTGSAPIYGCRAWFAVDCTRNDSGGSDTNNTNRFIYSSGNISYIQKIGTGSYRAVFATPMPNTNYSVIVNGNVGTNSQNDSFSEGTATNTLTSTDFGVSYNGSRHNGCTYYTGCIFA